MYMFNYFASFAVKDYAGLVLSPLVLLCLKWWTHLELQGASSVQYLLDKVLFTDNELVPSRLFPPSGQAMLI